MVVLKIFARVFLSGAFGILATYGLMVALFPILVDAYDPDYDPAGFISPVHIWINVLSVPCAASLAVLAYKMLGRVIRY